jgi:hypothetical protein
MTVSGVFAVLSRQTIRLKVASFLAWERRHSDWRIRFTWDRNAASLNTTPEFYLVTIPNNIFVVGKGNELI